MSLIALDKIASGTELTISYGGSPGTRAKTGATFAACYGFVPDDLGDDAESLTLRRALRKPIFSTLTTGAT